MATPVSGTVAVAKIGSTVVPAIDWKLDVDPKLKDTSTFADGRKKTKTLTDAKANLKLVWDGGSLPTDPAGFGLTDGASVTLKLYVDSTRFWSVPGLVAKLSPASEVEGVVMVDIEVDLSGTLVYPIP